MTSARDKRAYPSWAPPYLKEVHLNYLSDGRLCGSYGAILIGSKYVTEVEAADILYRLITDERMKAPWTTLKTHFERAQLAKRTNERLKAYWLEHAIDEELEPEPARLTRLNTHHSHYYQIVSNAIFSARTPESMPTLQAKKQKEKQFYGALRACDELLKILPQDYRRDDDYVGFPDTHHLLSNLNDPVVQRFSKHVRDTIERNTGFSGDELAWMWHDLAQGLPYMSWFVEQLRQSLSAKNDRQIKMPKPGDKNAHVHFFVRAMNRFFQSRYHRPFHAVVGALCSVVLQTKNDVSADLVRKLCSSTGRF